MFYEDWQLDEILSPANLFSSIDDVEAFIEMGTVDDLKSMLKVCDEEELFEYSALIRDKIKWKQNHK